MARVPPCPGCQLLEKYLRLIYLLRDDVLTVHINRARLLDRSLAGHAAPQRPGTQLSAPQIHGAAIAKRPEQMLIQIGLHIRMQAIRIAVLCAAQEAQVRDGGGVEEVLQAAQHHASAVDVARLEFPHRLDHGQGYLVLICGSTRMDLVSLHRPFSILASGNEVNMTWDDAGGLIGLVGVASLSYYGLVSYTK